MQLKPTFFTVALALGLSIATPPTSADNLSMAEQTLATQENLNTVKQIIKGGFSRQIARQNDASSALNDIKIIANENSLILKSIQNEHRLASRKLFVITCLFGALSLAMLIMAMKYLIKNRGKGNKVANPLGGDANTWPSKTPETNIQTPSANSTQSISPPKNFREKIQLSHEDQPQIVADSPQAKHPAQSHVPSERHDAVLDPDSQHEVSIPNPITEILVEAKKLQLFYLRKLNER